MKQTIDVAGTYVPASVKAGMIFLWHTVAKVLNALPLGIYECKICVNEFYAYLCNAKSDIQALQASRLRDNRKHWQFYYSPLHISLMCVGFCSFGLYRAAFCIIHLNAKPR